VASGGGEKLEKWGDYYLLRPDPQAIWAPVFDFSAFRMLHGKYNRSRDGGGAWEFFKTMPAEWLVTYSDMKFIISPTNFKHTGLFPEQAVNWDKTAEIITSAMSRTKTGSKILNLFGYTGGATIAAGVAGAYVTHVDSSKGMVDVCKRNAELNQISNDKIRYIVDDCAKFVAREIRRGNKYDAIIMDPPSFGRGANREVWKIEAHLDGLVDACCKLLTTRPLFFLINSYTTGLQPTVIHNVLKRNLEKNSSVSYNIESYEIGLPTLEDIVVMAGCSAIATITM